MDELDQFFQAIFKWDVAKRFVTPSAISQARRKLSHGVFVELLGTICRLVDEYASLVTFHGLRVFAIDGSTMRLPENQEVRDHFGTARNQRKECAMGRLSVLFDVFNRITYDAILGRYSTGEHSMAWQHLEEVHLPTGSLLVLDRGYFDFSLLRNIVQGGLHFCIRLRSNLGIYKAFNKLGVHDAILTLKTPEKLRRNTSSGSLFRKPLRVRIVRYQAKGETYTLMTSLLDVNPFTVDSLADLYHQRWQIEESYKVKKCRMRIEHVSGITPEIILQDFHGRIFAESLTAGLALEAGERVAATCRHRRYRYKICFAQALAKMKHVLALLFLREKPAPLLEPLLETFSRSLVSIEPGRSYPRYGLNKYAQKIQIVSFAYRMNR